MRLRSLQARLLAGVIGGVLLVWLASAVWVWADARHELDELLDSHLAQAAALVVLRQAGTLEDDHGDDHQDERDDDHHGDRARRDGRQDAPSLHRYARRVAFQVFADGQLVMRSANAPAAPMVALTRADLEGDDRERGRSVRAGRFHTVTVDGDAWRVFVARSGSDGRLVQVGERRDARDAILWAVLRAMLWPMAAALPLLALAAGWAVRRGLLPLRRLGRTLAERQPQSLQPLPDDAAAPTEMRPLTDALNGLFGRIGELMDTERRFTADAAHELRTPIAAIRTQAQVALAAEGDASTRRHALQATLAGCDRATRLVAQLLQLSRLESGQAPPMATVDLLALVRGVVADLAPQALDRGQAVQLVPDDEPTPAQAAALQVQGDATLLTVLVRNLVDNAVRYSPDGAEIRVQLLPPDGPGAGVRLMVDDSGPGLSTEDCARLGERFFRVLGSGQTGSGLGWSIVRRIAKVHGAQLTAGRSGALGGLGVTVAWPAR